MTEKGWENWKDYANRKETITKEDLKMKTQQHTPASWYLVACSGGVDICHKVNGEELVILETLGYELANEIVRAVNSHQGLLDAVKNAHLEVRHLTRHLGDCDLCELIAKAEGSNG